MKYLNFNFPDAVREYVDLVLTSCAASWITVLLMLIDAWINGDVTEGGHSVTTGDIVGFLLMTFVICPAMIKLIETVTDYAVGKLLNK